MIQGHPGRFSNGAGVTIFQSSDPFKQVSNILNINGSWSINEIGFGKFHNLLVLSFSMVFDDKNVIQVFYFQQQLSRLVFSNKPV